MTAFFDTQIYAMYVRMVCILGLFCDITTFAIEKCAISPAGRQVSYTTQRVHAIGLRRVPLASQTGRNVRYILQYVIIVRLAQLVERSLDSREATSSNLVLHT